MPKNHVAQAPGRGIVKVNRNQETRDMSTLYAVHGVVKAYRSDLTGPRDKPSAWSPAVVWSQPITDLTYVRCDRDIRRAVDVLTRMSRTDGFWTIAL